MDPEDLAVLAVAEVAARFLRGRTRALLGAALDNAVVLAGGVDHLAALPDRVADGLLDVDVLAGLAAEDGHGGVPVVGRRRGDRVDVVHLENFPVVLDDAEAGILLFGVARLAGVGVADRDDFYAGNGEHRLQVEPAAAAEADDRDANFFIGAEDVEGGSGEKAGAGGGDALEEAAAGGCGSRGRFHDGRG